MTSQRLRIYSYATWYGIHTLSLKFSKAANKDFLVFAEYLYKFSNTLVSKTKTAFCHNSCFSLFVGSINSLIVFLILQPYQ